MVEKKLQSSNLITYIREFIEELKKSDTVLLVEKINVLKITA